MKWLRDEHIQYCVQLLRAGTYPGCVSWEKKLYYGFCQKTKCWSLFLTWLFLEQPWYSYPWWHFPFFSCFTITTLKKKIIILSIPFLRQFILFSLTSALSKFLIWWFRKFTSCIFMHTSEIQKYSHFRRK